MPTWITSWIESFGYWGVFALMVLEHVFPPIPSEVVLPLAGFVSSSSSSMNVAGVIASGTIGSVVGSSVWYRIGRLVDQDQMIQWVARHGKWLALKPSDIGKAIVFFQHQSSSWIVGAARVVPGIRTYISVPAGLSKMPLIQYFIYTIVGTFIWTGLLAIAGYILGNQFDQVQHFVAPISKVVLGTVVIVIAMLMIYRFYQHRSAK